MTEPTVARIRQALQARRKDLDRLGVASLSVFGSVARDEATTRSDVDILVEFTEAATLARYMDLKVLWRTSSGGGSTSSRETAFAIGFVLPWRGTQFVSRDPSLLLEDMVRACEKVGRYLADRPRADFESDEQAFDATLKNLEVIGEAAKRLPAEFKESNPGIAWRDIAGLRDIIVHEYFALDRTSFGTWSGTVCRIYLVQLRPLLG